MTPLTLPCFLIAMCAPLPCQSGRPKAKPPLDHATIVKFTQTTKELLAMGELRQVIAGYEGLKSRLKVTKSDPRRATLLRLESLVFKARACLGFAREKRR